MIDISDKNIVLVGFMGSGKTTVSKELGKMLGRDVISTDAMIEKQEKAKIAEVFLEKGEPHFRQLERDIIIKISKKTKVIIDCGGGIILNPKNIEDLKKNGVVIFLSAPAEFLYEQIKDQTNRPLLNVENPLNRIKELLNQRMPLYKQAQYTIRSDRESIKEICDD